MDEIIGSGNVLSRFLRRGNKGVDEATPKELRDPLHELPLPMILAVTSIIIKNLH